jgi:hypothetical protein
MTITESNWTILRQIHTELGRDKPEPIVEAPTEKKWPTHYRCTFKESPKRANPNMVRQPGEIALKEYLMQRMEAEGISRMRAWQNFTNGQYPVTARHVNKRIVFVTVKATGFGE